jgi:hypothetical protein
LRVEILCPQRAAVEDEACMERRDRRVREAHVGIAGTAHEHWPADRQQARFPVAISYVFNEEDGIHRLTYFFAPRP